jgi:hypothetical protein
MRCKPPLTITSFLVLALSCLAIVTVHSSRALARSGAKDTSGDVPSPEPATPSSSSPEAIGASHSSSSSDPTTAERAPDDVRAGSQTTDERPRPVEPPQAPPPGVASIPATAVTDGQAPSTQPLVSYVEHLGPDSFPGRLRGLYGGSLWLEPSFNGLQWPYLGHTGLGVSGAFWLDSGYETIHRNQQQIANSKMYFQQGRGVLRLTPTYARDTFFVQGQLELVANICQAPNAVCTNQGTYTTDDLWIRVGQWNRWDLKVGRFEAWEVYHLGMGADQFTFERLGAGNFGVDTFTNPPLEAPSFYGVTYLHDRPNEGLALGYAALHIYPTDHFRGELLAKLGTDNNFADNSTGATPATYYGGRPTFILDAGWLRFKVGAEYQKRIPTNQAVVPGMPGTKGTAAAHRIQKGFGASLQFVIDPVVEFGLNAAIGRQDEQDMMARQVPEASFTTKSVGGFVNLRLADLWLLGVGVNWTAQTDAFLATSSTANDFTSHLQTFAALQYLLFGQLFIKADLAYARAYFQPSDLTVAAWHNDMYSGRVRLMYLY